METPPAFSFLFSLADRTAFQAKQKTKQKLRCLTWGLRNFLAVSYVFELGQSIYHKGYRLTEQFRVKALTNKEELEGRGGEGGRRNTSGGGGSGPMEKRPG